MIRERVMQNKKAVVAAWTFNCPCKNDKLIRKEGGSAPEGLDFILRKESFGNLYYSKSKTPIFHESYFEGVAAEKGMFIFSAPVVAILEITGKCNLNCIHCYRPENERASELTFEETKGLLHQLAEMNVVGVQYIGGEPFLHKDLKEMLRLSKDYGFKTEVISNGYAISDLVINECCDLIDGLYISIDGTEKTHNKIRQNPQSFRYAIQSIEKFSKRDVFTTAVMTLNKENYKEIEEVYSIVSAHGAEGLFLKKLLPVGRGKTLNNLCLNKVDLASFAERLVAIRKTDTGISYSNCVPVQGEYAFFGCPGGRSQVVIDCDSNVYRCLYRKAVEDRLGNIKHAPFKEIWKQNNNTLIRCECKNSDRCGGLCTIK